MVDNMKHGHEEAARANEIDLEKINTTFSEAEVCIEMVMKEELNKELERKNTKIGLIQWKLIAIRR